ncbi:MAG TPA: hypothetical protein ENL18_02215 [Thermoplasmatales archaeon]|nr:hypothetical protein [Thermoplasmatales archaeon]
MKRNLTVLMSAGIVALFVMTAAIPSLVSSGGSKEVVECSISDIVGTKVQKKSLSVEEANEMERKISGILDSNRMPANISEVVERIIDVLRDYGILQDRTIFGKTWGWGVFNYIISYGRGEIYIPLKSDRSFVRIMLRPILFNYNAGITVAKFGTNYMWDSMNTVGNVGWMLGRQRGFTVGFVGIHVRIPHALHPDSHLFIGTTLILNGNNLLF